MRDAEFKKLKHSCNGYAPYERKKLEDKYNPDYILVCCNKYILFEHETEPNRKTIVADIFKAAYFLSGSRRGILVIVMTPKGGSSFKSYHKHVLPYFKWLLDRTNLEDVIFVEEHLYFQDEIVLTILGETFAERSVSMKLMLQNDL